MMEHEEIVGSKQAVGTKHKRNGAKIRLARGTSFVMLLFISQRIVTLEVISNVVWTFSETKV